MGALLRLTALQTLDLVSSRGYKGILLLRRGLRGPHFGCCDLGLMSYTVFLCCVGGLVVLAEAGVFG